MEIYYYQDPIGNFGDDLNAWLWPKLFPSAIQGYFDDDTMLVGIGTLLNHKIPPVPTKKLVFGSGYGYGRPPSINEKWLFYCVRGPLTAEVLGLSEKLAICDSALLFRELIEPAQNPGEQIAFMPHHRTSRNDNWKEVCDALDIQYIDPTESIEKIINSIRDSKLVITEAMHGAIVADALRIPWIPVKTRSRILEFKWQDWARTLNIKHEFEWLPPAWSNDVDKNNQKVFRPIASIYARERLRWLIRHGKRRLSRDDVLEQVYERLLEAFNKLLDDATMERNRGMV